MTLLPATIIHALYTSRIENGNSLLTGITDCLLHKRQLAQNAAYSYKDKKIWTHNSYIKRPSLATYSWDNQLQNTHFNLESFEWHCTRVFISSSSSFYSKSHASVFWKTLTCRSTGFICIWRSSSFSCCTQALELLPLNIRNCNSFQTFKNLLKTYLLIFTYGMMMIDHYPWLYMYFNV